jgi:hypothetical protein
LCAIGVVSSPQLANGWCFGLSEYEVVPTFNRFGADESGVVSVFEFPSAAFDFDVSGWRWRFGLDFHSWFWREKDFKYSNAVLGMKLLGDAFIVLRSKLFVL